MVEQSLSNEYDENVERLLLTEEILDRTKQLLISDSHTVVMTYEHAINMMHRTDYDELTGLIRRSTLRAVDGLSKVLEPDVVEEIVPSETCYYHLMKKEPYTSNQLVYVMTEINTKSGGTTKLMTISVGGSRVHRIRGVLMTEDGEFSSTTELRPLWDEFASEANRLVDDNLVNVVSPLLQGRLPIGQELTKCLDIIRASLEFNRTDVDVDMFIHQLTERYYSMCETNEFRKKIGMDDTEMTVEQLQELNRYLAGNSRSLDIYSK